MVKKTVDLPDTEPNTFTKPSEGEHLFQVVDVIENLNGTLSVKFEVVGGEENGRSLLHRVNLDENWKGFFFTRLFLKAINEPYKGSGVEIDSDNWVGKQCYAEVVHVPSKDGTKTYANISGFNFDKSVTKAWDE